VIRHEVIVRVRPEVARESIDRTLREVSQLLREIQGVASVRSGANDASAYRHALIVVDLADEVALHRFQRHPLHTRAVRLVGRMAESTAVGSYVVSSERRW
jgi:hypothetical protein